MKKALVLLIDGFEEIEAMSIVDILRRLDIQVTTLGVIQKQVTGAHGVPVIADALLRETDISAADALILPGGAPGSWNLRDSEDTLQCIREFHKQGKWIAAICAAPIALAKAGILEGKTVTAYPAEPVANDLPMACNTGNRIEQDGNIITSKGPGTAIDFAFHVAGALGCTDAIPAMRKEMILED